MQTQSRAIPHTNAPPGGWYSGGGAVCKAAGDAWACGAAWYDDGANAGPCEVSWRRGVVKMLRVSMGFGACVLILVGCASPLAGNYMATVEPVPGAEARYEPGYTLEEVRSRLIEEPRLLLIESNGTYTLTHGDTRIQGRWREDGGTLYLRDTVYNGSPIGEPLQSDRKYTVGPAGEIIDTGTYGAYGLQQVYRR